MRSLSAIIPHPDDESYSFGGLLALASAAGWQCRVFCASDGEAGERHDGGTPGREALAATREAELRASCAVLGAEAPVFWRLPDGGLTEEMLLPHVREVFAPAPDLVVALGRDGAYGHPDHLALHTAIARAVGEGLVAGRKTAVMFAVFRCGLFLPQFVKCVASGIMGDPPLLSPQDIGAQPAGFVLDIAAVADRKLASIASHRSQLPGGNPHAIFPPGIVDGLLCEGRFVAATPLHAPRISALLQALESATGHPLLRKPELPESLQTPG